jgi:hypothetical protein
LTPAPAPAPEPTLTPKPPLSPSKLPRKGKATDAQAPPGFEAFWIVWPKKEAKADAVKAWRDLSPNENLSLRIIEAVNAQITYKARLKAAKEFCPEWPLPATWLHGKRWEDELSLPSALAAGPIRFKLRDGTIMERRETGDVPVKQLDDGTWTVDEQKILKATGPSINRLNEVGALITSVAAGSQP